MTPAEIKIALAQQGFTQADIARALDANPSTVCSVIHGRYLSKKIAIAICKLINNKPEDVFPDQIQYHDNYNPVQNSQHRVDEIRQRLAS